jgi:glutamate/tyrosine decarboxylase-like PLP-dependent enzyme
VHEYDHSIDQLARSVFRYALERVRMDPPLDGPETPETLRARAGATVTPEGLGGQEALRVWADVLAPATISQDHARNLSFVPSAPTEAAVLFDLVVGASSVYGGSWKEGAGAVHAENEALRWLADLAGFPPAAGGCFVSGGTAANLGALVAARAAARTAAGGRAPGRWALATSAEAHSSIDAAAHVMDVDIVRVPSDDRGRLTGGALARTLHDLPAERRAGLFAVVATGGTTNAGMVDDIAGVAERCGVEGLWLHVDAAYGGAALAAPSARYRFDGIERADSFAVDPHKWLFAPYDCAALVYRAPEVARRAHTQHAAYLDVLHEPGEWNPSDYAFHLTRRARGLPFWFSLAVHGTDAYQRAVERTLATTRAAARLAEQADHTELVLAPELSVVLVRRRGWSAQDYARWSDRLLADGVAFCVPTTWRGETVARLCIVNPLTTVDDIRLVLDSMR